MSAVYTLIVFFSRLRVKIVLSIEVTPSSAVIYHVSDPQTASRLPKLVAAESGQLKIAAVSPML